jgi:hypothetical protein
MMKFTCKDELCLWLSNTYKQNGWEGLAQDLLDKAAVCIEDKPKTPIKQLVEMFALAYKKATGVAYVPAYAKDAASFKRVWQAIESGEDPMQLMQDVIDYFFSPEHEFIGNADIAFFCSRFNRLQIAVMKKKNNQPMDWSDV